MVRPFTGVRILSTVSGQARIRVIKADGAIIDIGQVLDTAFAYLETKDLVLEGKAVFYLDAIDLDIDESENASNFFLIPKWRDDKRNIWKEATRIDIGKDAPGSLIPLVGVESARRFRFRFEHNGVNVRTRINGFTLYGDVDSLAEDPL